MDVDVHDGDPLPASPLGVAGGDGHVVEDAEAHRPRRGGVVPRGPADREGVVGAPFADGVDRRQRRTHRAERRLAGAGRAVGVAVEPPPSPRRHRPHRGHVGRGVDQLDGRLLGGAGIDPGDGREVGLGADALEDRRHPVGPLRVPGRGVLGLRPGGDQQEAHAGLRGQRLPQLAQERLHVGHQPEGLRGAAVGQLGDHRRVDVDAHRPGRRRQQVAGGDGVEHGGAHDAEVDPGQRGAHPPPGLQHVGDHVGERAVVADRPGEHVLDPVADAFVHHPAAEDPRLDRGPDAPGGADAVDRAHVQLVAGLDGQALLQTQPERGAEELGLDVVGGQPVAGEEHLHVAGGDQAGEVGARHRCG